MTVRRFLFAMCLAIGSFATAATFVPPQPIKTFDPEFPFDAFKEGRSGTAMVEFWVEMNGSVSNASVVKATDPDFGASAASCISKWKFTPATADGRKVRAKLRQSFTFENPKKKKKGEPGATDNPDDAQRSREDH